MNEVLDAKTTSVLEQFVTCIDFKNGNGAKYPGETERKRSNIIFKMKVVGTNSTNPRREF